MNLPNKLTILRMIMIPVFLFFLLMPTIAHNDWIALAIFILASLTDLLDGHIARKYALITNFGKFMDPLADKLLVCSALIALAGMGRMPSWMVILIIAREFIISGFRLLAVEQGLVIAASFWGKLKTNVQIVLVCLLIMNIEGLWLITEIVMWLAIILTIVSLMDYLYKNRSVMGSVR